MTTCLGRLGSRFSLILDPVRREVHYGALGLKSQFVGQLMVGLDDGEGNLEVMPFCSDRGMDFTMLEQRHSMTSVIYEAYSMRHGLRMRMEIISPFWPQDVPASTVPAYIVNIELETMRRVRAKVRDNIAKRTGVLFFGLDLPDAKISGCGDALEISYPVEAWESREKTDDGFEINRSGRRNPLVGISTDSIFAISGDWKCSQNCLRVEFDLRKSNKQCFSLGMAAYCGDALFERFGKPMKLEYTHHWRDIKDVAGFIKNNHHQLCEKSRKFDSIWTDSPLPLSACELTALSFQSYLMNTLWARGKNDDTWFSVWEGNCTYNSTVDVAYNEAMFYFACWPQLLEMIFDEWTEHGNDKQAEAIRSKSAPVNYASKSRDKNELEFPGVILEHDMGRAWTANGQSYPHAMPVEENSNFLLLLYAHCCWWDKKELLYKYVEFCKKLVEYLLWTDSTGNGFPDRGRANTFDDSAPAFQYGRDNVYLGVKRLSALHAARRIFEITGQDEFAERCKQAVEKAVRTLNDGYLGDHFGVCLDKNAKGLCDCLTGEPLDCDELPGWDDYAVMTSSGLLYLLMIDDLPQGISLDKFRDDLLNTNAKKMSPYGTSHMGKDDYPSVWISANIWRDCIGGYLGENLTANCERYWRMQIFGNAQGSDKANCFIETAPNNNLYWYPRGVASFGYTFSLARLVINRLENKIRNNPVVSGKWPLLPLSDWAENEIVYS